MKLYELPRGTLFTLKEQPTMPPDISWVIDTQKIYKLHNIDGMYSYVTDEENIVYHFAAWTEVIPLNEYSNY